MLFFDHRRRMSRVLNQDEFKSSAGSPLSSPFNSQATIPAESDGGRKSLLQDSSPKATCTRCSSYACRLFPSLSLADWVLLQLIMGALLFAALSGIAGAELVSLAKKHFDIDMALWGREVYHRARCYFQYQ